MQQSNHSCDNVQARSHPFLDSESLMHVLCNFTAFPSYISHEESAVVDQRHIVTVGLQRSELLDACSEE